MVFKLQIMRRGFTLTGELVPSNARAVHHAGIGPGLRHPARTVSLKHVFSTTNSTMQKSSNFTSTGVTSPEKWSARTSATLKEKRRRCRTALARRGLSGRLELVNQVEERSHFVQVKRCPVTSELLQLSCLQLIKCVREKWKNPGGLSSAVMPTTGDGKWWQECASIGASNCTRSTFNWSIVWQSVFQMNREVTGCQFHYEPTEEKIVAKPGHTDCLFYTGSATTTTTTTDDKSPFRCLVFPHHQQADSSLDEIQALSKEHWVKILSLEPDTQYVTTVLLTLPQLGQARTNLRRVTISGDLGNNPMLNLEVMSKASTKGALAIQSKTVNSKEYATLTSYLYFTNIQFSTNLYTFLH